MRELVIVIADLHWQADQQPETDIDVPPGALPGLTLAARYGQTAQLSGGWSGWLARWLGRDDLAGLAPGTLAALLAQAPLPQSPPGSVFIASPVHLLAGLSSVHLDRRGLLRLPLSDLEPLAADFNRSFGDSPFRLAAVPPADLILLGPPAQVETVEPARAVLIPLAQALPQGSGAQVLRALSAEIEMWLHGHAVNQARATRGEPSVSALWAWGGGTLQVATAAAAPHPQTLVFAQDIRARGLAHGSGGAARALPDTLEEVLSYAGAQRAALIAEAGPVLQTNPRLTLAEALSVLDAQWIAPALEALRRGRLGSLVLIANGCSLSLRSKKDLRRWWRPRRAPLAGLSA